MPKQMLNLRANRSVRLVANVLDYVHGLPHGTKLLLLCLADYADDKGR